MNADVLALIRNSLADTPIWDWLEPGTPLRVVTQPSAVDTAVPAHVDLLTVADYDHSPAVELAALDAFRTRPFSHLEVISEWDVLRGARLRERLGLPGQRYASAAAFRDKALMKQRWTVRGVPTARHARIELPGDLMAFFERRRGPIVVKPRRAAGSLGVSVLHTPRDARAWLGEHWHVPAGEFSPWMAEDFVTGQLIQVDGFYDHGCLEIAWPTAIGSLLSWQDDTGAPVLAAMLDANDPVVDDARTLVRRALAALPTPPRTAFHAELWLTDHGLQMNEIAARVGGAGTARMIEAAFGVNLHRRAVRASVYAEHHDVSASPRPRVNAGFAMVPRRAGRIRRVAERPASLDHPWLVSCSIRVAAGEMSPPAHNSVDAAAQFVASGQHRDQVLERLTRATDWALQAIEYEHNTLAAAV